MKRVYICSSLRGNVEENRKKAERYCRYAVRMGAIPYAPHAYFTRFLNDDVPEERDLGMCEGLFWLSLCSEIWVFGDVVTAGMQKEIDYAQSHHIFVRRVLGKVVANA